MATGKRLVFHSVALIHHIIALSIINACEIHAASNIIVRQIHEFSHCYFTIWTFVFQMVFLTCSILCDIGEIKPELVELFWPKHELMKRSAEIRDFLFKTIVFPCTLITAILFWTVYSYDRNLVYPEVVDEYIPQYINHALHTNIIPVVVLEMILGKKKSKTNIKKSMIAIGVLVVLYNSVFLWTYYSTGRWIYALFDVFSWTERCFFFAFLTFCTYILFFLGTHLQEIVHEYSIIKNLHKTSNQKDNAVKEINRNEKYEKHSVIKHKTSHRIISDSKLSTLEYILRKFPIFGRMES